MKVSQLLEASRGEQVMLFTDYLESNQVELSDEHVLMLRDFGIYLIKNHYEVVPVANPDGSIKHGFVKYDTQKGRLSIGLPTLFWPVSQRTSVELSYFRIDTRQTLPVSKFRGLAILPLEQMTKILHDFEQLCERA